jgi:hypothetical protein
MADLGAHKGAKLVDGSCIRLRSVLAAIALLLRRRHDELPILL